MKHTIICWFAFFLILGNAVAAGERTARFPFYGEQPLGPANKVASVRNAAKLTFGKEGVLIGKGQEAPEVMLPDWRGEQGTVAFWIKAVDWDAGTKEHVVLVAPIAPEGGGFLLYKYQDVDKIWFLGQGRQNNINFAYDGLKGWKKGQWHHIGFAWKRGSSAKLYVDGVLTNAAEGAFLFPDSMKGLVLGTAGVASMGGNVQSIIRDLYVAPVLLSDSEIGQLARNRPEGGGGQGSPSPPQTANVFAFPQVKQSPTIDGKIEPGEYPGMFSGFVAADTHAAYPEKTQFATAADADSIYLAAAITLPEGYTLTSFSNTRDDPVQVGTGDLFCLFIRPDAETDKKAFSGVYLTVAPNGNLYDAQEDIDWGTMNCLRKADFNAVIQTASVLSNGVWVVELKIARKSLGLQKNEPFSFAAGFQIGSSRIALQDHPLWFDHCQAFSRGVFTLLGVQTALGRLSEGRIALTLSLLNQGNALVNGQASLKVGLPLIKETAAGMVVEKKFGEKLEVELRDILQDWKEPFAVRPGAKAALRKEVNLSEPNTYGLVAEVGTGHTVIYRQQLPFMYSSPVEVTLKRVPSKELIKAQLSFYGVDRARLGGRTELSFVSATSKKEVLQESFPVSGPSETVTFSMHELPPGTYDVTASLFDKAGTNVGRRNVRFEKWATPDWLKDRKGVEALTPDWVPSPWTPIQVTKETKPGDIAPTLVSVWGRSFAFQKGSFLAGLTSQNLPLLKSAFVVKYVIQGQERSFDIGAPKVALQSKGRAEIVQQGTSPDFSFTATHRIEFDGMDRLDIGITPSKHAQIEKLWLEMPFTNISLDFIDVSGASRAFGQPDNREFTDLPNIWLGNDKVGCACFAESCKGWLINSKKPRITLKSDRGTSVIRYYIVNESSEVTAPLAFTLGLHPTPVKPFFKNWRAIRAQGWCWSPPPTNLYMTCGEVWMSSVSVPAPRNWKVLDDMVADARTNKQTVYPYLTPFTISLYDMVKRDMPYFRPPQPKDSTYTDAKVAPKIEAYWYYAEDWNLSPHQPSGDPGGRETGQMACVSPSSTWADYFVGGVEEILRRSDIDGFYFDLPKSLPNFDESKGLAYTTKDGVREGATEYFAMRDLYKRLHWLFEKYRGPTRKPYILGHGFPAELPVSSFWDVNFHGEALRPSSKFEYTRWFLQNRLEANPVAKPAAPDAPRSFDALAYRATQGLQFGLPIMYLPEYGYGPNLCIPEHSRELLSWTFLHNTILWPAWLLAEPVYKFWNKVEIPFGMGDTTFYPYFENGVVCRPECIKVSYWKKDGRDDYLVGVANWSDKPADATITLPPALAGFAQCLDMEKGKPLMMSKSWQVAVPAHDLRAFRFSGNIHSK